MKIKHLKTLTKAEYFHSGALPCIVRVMKAAPSNDAIALRCGFADASHLIRTFHRHGRTLPRKSASSRK